MADVLFGFLGLLFCALLLFGTIFYQAKKLKVEAIHLPEAAGPRCVFNDAPLILHVGESPVAGVGVSHMEQGLTSNLVTKLKENHQLEFDWQVLAQNGIRVLDALTMPLPKREPEILLLTFGVNDTTKFTNTKTWLHSLIDCQNYFAKKSTTTYVTAVPQMQHFPLLPAPLSWLLGIRSFMLDKKLKKLCLQQNWTYIANTSSPEPNLMAIDGFHPNEAGYQIWAEQIAKVIAQKEM